MNNNEPIILGTVKKGKTGKPLVVIIVFLFVGSILLFLPTIKNYFGDYNVFELITNGEIINFFTNHDYYMNKDTIIQTTTKEVDKNEPVLINNKAVITFNNFTLNNFKLETDKITFNIITSNNINFDKSYYYLVLSKGNKDIITLKLIGENKGETELTLLFNKTLENTLDINGTIKEIKKEDYPKVTLSSDEAGFATLLCKNSDNTIEYLFSNNNLINIIDVYTYIDRNNGEYLNMFQKYSNLSNELNSLGAISNIIEDSMKFVMTTNIDLNNYQYDNNKNINYYSLNTEPKIINFEMEAKGFDCE